MPKPEQNGSLLREYDPEFEEGWDKRYEQAKASMSDHTEQTKPEPEGLHTIQSIGDRALNGSARMTPVQEELF
jgi:hypothetical protein